ncbi:MAG: hypothetical protein NT151_09970 [Acidobacteria bacterium]|nr:hypothetical protein [Acidobacteriota bacterium]
MNIRRIAKLDSLKNGTIIGACVGAVFGAVALGLEQPVDSAGKKIGFVPDTVGKKIGVMAGVIAMYAGIGALIDYAIKGRETVYERPVGVPSVHLSPIVAPHSVGVAGTIAW